MTIKFAKREAIGYGYLNGEEVGTIHLGDDIVKELVESYK